MPYFLSLYGVKAFDLGSARLPLPLPQMVVTLLCLCVVNVSFSMVFNVISWFQCLFLYYLWCNILISIPLYIQELQVFLIQTYQNFLLIWFLLVLVPQFNIYFFINFNSTYLSFSKSFLKDLIVFLHFLGKQICSCFVTSTWNMPYTLPPISSTKLA